MQNKITFYITLLVVFTMGIDLLGALGQIDGSAPSWVFLVLLIVKVTIVTNNCKKLTEDW